MAIAMSLAQASAFGCESNETACFLSIDEATLPFSRTLETSGTGIQSLGRNTDVVMGVNWRALSHVSWYWGAFSLLPFIVTVVRRKEGGGTLTKTCGRDMVDMSVENEAQAAADVPVVSNGTSSGGLHFWRVKGC